MEKFEIINTELEALQNELELTERRKFCHECKDRWTSEDYEIHEQFNQKIKDLQTAIKALS